MPTLPGPRGPIAYERDALGYPRLRARDLDDGTFARGYLHATDRLVQIQLTQLAARGRLMEVLGDKPLARRVDRAVRTLNFAGDLDEQEARLSPRARGWLQSYCDGLNAGAAERGWPVALRLLGVAPERYTIGSIFLAYRLISFFGLSSMVQTAKMLATELAARGAPMRAFELLLGPDAARGIDLPTLSRLRVARELALLETPLAAGSNAFAVSAARSATGSALLVGEFHMETGRFPPIVYACHEDYDDGGYYQGLGLPGVAWLSAGRTPRVAWTYTYAHADHVDILVERCEAERYLAAGEFRPFTRRVERVKVRGGRDEAWTFYDNPYGTLVGDAREAGDHPCVRWSGLRETARDVEACRAGIDCANVRELADAHREIRTVSLEAVLADAAGDVARVHTGQVDARPAGWSGAYPRAAWDLASREPAPLGEETRPVSYREERVVSANQRTDGPRGERWCTLPEPGYRHARITALLDAPGAPMDAKRLARISYDEYDGCAARLVPVWAPRLPADDDAARLARWAREQGARQDPEGRRAMGLFHALHAEVTRALLAPLAGDAATARIVDELHAVLLFQEHLDAALALERPELLDEAQLTALLARAWPRAKERVARGFPVPIRARFKNVLFAGKLPSALGFDSEPVDFPGGPTAPFQTRMIEYEGESIVGGPAFHMVIDMGKPGGWYHVPGGASEQRLGPGYGRGVDAWLRGVFFPLGDPPGEPPNV